MFFTLVVNDVVLAAVVVTAVVLVLAVVVVATHCSWCFSYHSAAAAVTAAGKSREQVPRI